VAEQWRVYKAGAIRDPRALDMLWFEIKSEREEFTQMPDKIDVRAVEAILYGVYRALYDVVGSSAAAVMRKAAPDILEMFARLGVDFSCVDDVDKLSSKVRETAVATGMCEDMKFTLEGNDLTANITQCSFFPLTSKLKEDGIPPFGCPFSALTIAIAEKNLGKRARVKILEPAGNPGDTRLVVELMDK
jgi:predicted hydrocarbon binding protein